MGGDGVKCSNVGETQLTESGLNDRNTCFFGRFGCCLRVDRLNNFINM